MDQPTLGAARESGAIGVPIDSRGRSDPEVLAQCLAEVQADV